MWPFGPKDDWVPLSIEHVEDVSFGTPGILDTRILYRTPSGKFKTHRIPGHWTWEELFGAR